MRIIGNIPNEQYKITVFQMNGKLSVKIEDQLLEQTYKFRDGSGIENVNDIEQLIDDEYLKEITNIFEQMEKLKYQSLISKISNGEEFDEII